MNNLRVFAMATLLCVAWGGAQAQQLQRVTLCGDGLPGPGLSPGTQDTTGKACVTGTTTISPASSTPAASTASALVLGGAATTIITGPVNGCYVVNPATAADQNIVTAETAYINPVTTATANGRGTNSALVPGQPWSCPPGMTTNVSFIAATTAHALNVVKW